MGIWLKFAQGSNFHESPIAIELKRREQCDLSSDFDPTYIYIYIIHWLFINQLGDERASSFEFNLPL